MIAIVIEIKSEGGNMITKMENLEIMKISTDTKPFLPQQYAPNKIPTTQPLIAIIMPHLTMTETPHHRRQDQNPHPKDRK